MLLSPFTDGDDHAAPGYFSSHKASIETAAESSADGAAVAASDASLLGRVAGQRRTSFAQGGDAGDH
jgi:hypothetical protein